MDKLKLEIDALRVESFEASPEVVERGTVRAASDPQTYYEEWTCGGTCLEKCRLVTNEPPCMTTACGTGIECASGVECLTEFTCTCV